MGCQVSLYFQGLSHSLGKAAHLNRTVRAARSRVPLPTVQVFPWVLCKVPALGRTLHNTNALRFPMRRSTAVPLTTRLAPLSWALVLLILPGPCGISHSSARIPQFSASEMFPRTPYFSPRGLTTLSLFCKFPISPIHSQTRLWFHISHLLTALGGPHVPPSEAGTSSMCSSNTVHTKCSQSPGTVPRIYTPDLISQTVSGGGRIQDFMGLCLHFPPLRGLSSPSLTTTLHATLRFKFLIMVSRSPWLKLLMKKTKNMQMPPWAWGKGKMEAPSLWTQNNLGLISKFSRQSCHFCGSWYPST